MATNIQVNREANENQRRDAAARLEETKRSNKAHERISRASQKEQVRSNLVNEAFREKQLKMQRNAAIASGIGQAIGGIAGATAMGLINDLAWYVPSEDVAGAIMNLPSRDPVGTQYITDSIQILENDAATVNATIIGANGIQFPIASAPAIMTMSFMPSIGYNQGVVSPINQTFDTLWTIVNERNGRNSSYQASDMAFYQIGLSGCVLLLGYMERLYSWTGRFVADNDALPRGIFRSLNVDYDDFSKHKYDLRALILEFRHFLRKYRRIPGVYLLDRYYYMGRITLMDNLDNDRCQLYHYRPLAIPYVDVLTAETSVQYLDFLSPTKNSLTFDTLFTNVQTLMGQFIGAQDIKIMNADIVAAFGEAASNWLDFDVFEENQPLYITTDAMALNQFANATCVMQRDPATYAEWQSLRPKIYQETLSNGKNIVVSSHRTRAADATNLSIVVDGVGVKASDMTPGFLIEASRLIVPFDTTENYFMSELPVACRITMLNPKKLTYAGSQLTPSNGVDIRQDYVPTFEHSQTTNDDGAASNDIYMALFAARAFKYAPMQTFTRVWDSDEYPNQYRVEAWRVAHWDAWVAMPARRLIEASRRIAKHMLGGSTTSAST